MRRLLVAALLLLHQRADAVPCDDGSLNLPNIVYAQVGDTQNNLMRRLSRALRDNNPSITLIWTTSGSCANINAIYTRVPISTTTNMNYAPSIAQAATWNVSTDPTLQCTPPAGTVPDIANSALFNSACTQDAPPSTVHLEFGPVQAYVMAVPEASTQTAITFEEAYFVFGFGLAGMVQPWNDEAAMFIRTVTKSTLLAWAANISVPADKWKGIRRDGSPMVVSDLQMATAPEKAIGILGAEVYDGLRDSLNVLAFRAKGQYAAYYPDSTATARDKQNVRDGHYTVWSPTVWMDTTDGNGTPVNPNTRYVTQLIAGKSVSPAPTGFDIIDFIAAVGLVPDCAMRVKRSFEGGPLSLYKPAESCTCKYESLVATTSCTACDTNTPCATGTCLHGYCEVQ
jgi:hypothetical protein